MENNILKYSIDINNDGIAHIAAKYNDKIIEFDKEMEENYVNVKKYNLFISSNGKDIVSLNNKKDLMIYHKNKFYYRMRQWSVDREYFLIGSKNFNAKLYGEIMNMFYGKK